MLDNTLIEKALALTGKNIHCMNNSGYLYPESEDDKSKLEFRIEKFCYYLLSPEFIEKYQIKRYGGQILESDYFPMRFGRAIYEYQKGNEYAIEDLLKKI